MTGNWANWRGRPSRPFFTWRAAQRGSAGRSALKAMALCALCAGMGYYVGRASTLSAPPARQASAMTTPAESRTSPDAAPRGQQTSVPDAVGREDRLKSDIAASGQDQSRDPKANGAAPSSSQSPPATSKRAKKHEQTEARMQGQDADGTQAKAAVPPVTILNSGSAERARKHESKQEAPAQAQRGQDENAQPATEKSSRPAHKRKSVAKRSRDWQPRYDDRPLGYREPPLAPRFADRDWMREPGPYGYRGPLRSYRDYNDLRRSLLRDD